MNYEFIKEVIELVGEFDTSTNTGSYLKNLAGFKRWIYDTEIRKEFPADEPVWEGKEKGRSPDSVISTLLVHMNRYAKTYSRAAIHNSGFTTQEDFIYLINLKAFGAMTKMDLINKNIQDKPTGVQIINRLIKKGWVAQTDSETDKRSKVISITTAGLESLELQMDKIRQATTIVAGNLLHAEKMELIRLLNKLNDFHHPIFSQHMDSNDLLDKATGRLSKSQQS